MRALPKRDVSLFYQDQSPQLLPLSAPLSLSLTLSLSVCLKYMRKCNNEGGKVVHLYPVVCCKDRGQLHDCY